MSYTLVSSEVAEVRFLYFGFVMSAVQDMHGDRLVHSAVEACDVQRRGHHRLRVAMRLSGQIVCVV